MSFEIHDKFLIVVINFSFLQTNFAGTISHRTSIQAYLTFNSTSASYYAEYKVADDL